MELWEITEEKILAAVEKIVEVSNPVSIIIFGSYARRQLGQSSLSTAELFETIRDQFVQRN